VQIRRFISKERIKRVQNLSWLSEDTGADALRGAGKYDQFRQVMSSDLNYYYQLSFYPKRKKADDKYHKIIVEVKRRGVDIRHRKGYTDYSKEGANRLKLITAFYNPSLYKELPFEASFIPFVNDSEKYVPWMNIALPTQELFLDKNLPQGKKTFNLHIWISDTQTGEKGFGGTIDLPIKINPSFMDYARSVSHVSFHFKGQSWRSDPPFIRPCLLLPIQKPTKSALGNLFCLSLNLRILKRVLSSIVCWARWFRIPKRLKAHLPSQKKTAA
jgi:hypothetical protein